MFVYASTTCLSSNVLRIPTWSKGLNINVSSLPKALWRPFMGRTRTGSIVLFCLFACLFCLCFCFVSGRERVKTNDGRNNVTNMASGGSLRIRVCLNFHFSTEIVIYGHFAPHNYRTIRMAHTNAHLNAVSF